MRTYGRPAREREAMTRTCPVCGALPRYLCVSVVQGSSRVLKHPHEERARETGK
jgi:hypothetical protein